MNQLSLGVGVALLLASSIVSAEDYPAADFKPKVVYSDSSATEAATKAAPAAKKAEAAVEADASHPAANFQPKVVYNDSGYKHTDTAPSLAGGSAAKPAAKTATEASSPVAETTTTAEKPASNNLPLFAVIAAVAAFVLFGRKPKPSCSKSTCSGHSHDYTSSPSADGLTGVARYLEKVSPTKTGVAKYLEKQEATATPVTGVAKYMAKQAIKNRA